MTDVALFVNSASVGLQAGRQLVELETGFAEAPLIVISTFVRNASFVLMCTGLLAIGAQLDNPMGDDPSDLPALAYQVSIKKECESFAFGVDAVDVNAGWWEGLGGFESGAAAGMDRNPTASATPTRILPDS